MTFGIIRTAVVATAGCVITLLFVSQVSAQTLSPVASVVDAYCVRCHDGSGDPSGTAVVPLDAAHIADEPELWSRAERHLRAGTMPPVGSKRPDRRTSEAAITAIEHALDTPAPAVESSATIAARLATLLWNAAPDAALMRAAQRDQLRDSAPLEREVRRMLADPRAEAFVARFFVPWLQLDKVDPDRSYFAGYDPSLRDALRRETELFLLSQLRDDRDPVELWTANYTFLNEQLAKHYGIPGVTGAQFRKITLSMPQRYGLLGQGSILMANARFQHVAGNTYTSPAARGAWVLTRFLGVSTPSAFPGAQPISPDLPVAGQARRLPDNPCTNCHRNFFPLGYALENFDAIGRWRVEDQVEPVNASGALVDGTPFDGPVQLREALLQRPDAFRTTITERLLVHVAGGAFANHRGSSRTLAAARRILRDTSPVHWSTLIAAAVRTTPIGLD